MDDLRDFTFRNCYLADFDLQILTYTEEGIYGIKNINKLFPKIFLPITWATDCAASSSNKVKMPSLLSKLERNVTVALEDEKTLEKGGKKLLWFCANWLPFSSKSKWSKYSKK